MSKAMLDIILTMNESMPVSYLNRFLNIIDYQQCVDKDDIEVTLVYSENIPSSVIYDTVNFRSFHVNALPIAYTNVAQARNAGMDSTHADWIMFCDPRDMFTDVCSIEQILQVMPTSEANIIWSQHCKETTLTSGKTFFINLVKELQLISTNGMLYRRLFLYENDIRFNEDLPEFCEYLFNMVVNAETEHFMIKQLTTDIYPYFVKYKAPSVQQYRDQLQLRFQREIILANEMEKRGKNYLYRRAMVQLFADAYYNLYDPENEQKPELSDVFIEFYRKNRKLLDTFSQADMEIIRAGVETECLNTAQNLYGEHRQELYFVNDDITFEQWVQDMDDKYIRQVDKPDNTPALTPVVSLPAQKKAERVVVYCGTYNVYPDMVTSAKSLLCNTPVDKIYFLTEDDEFPYELPDIIENINVKNQKYFKHDGPNFNNAWTYMCMIRTAFPEMFSQYDKILSLDIDIIVNDDISDLWDYDMTDYYIAGVPENNRQRKSTDPVYVNFGVVIMNLKRLRESGLQQKMIDTLNTQKTDCPEQGVYNRYCAGHILSLPNDYNVTLYSHITGEPMKERVLHYAGQKYWKHYSNVTKYSNLTWDEVMERQAKLHE